MEIKIQLRNLEEQYLKRVIKIEDLNDTIEITFFNDNELVIETFSKTDITGWQLVWV